MNRLKTIFYDNEKLWNYDLKNLQSIKGVKRLDELTKLLIKLKDDKKFHNICKLANGPIAAKDNNFDYNIKKVPFLYTAKKGLGIQLPFYLPPITKLIDIFSLVSVYSMIQASYIFNSGHRLNNEEDKAIQLSDIMAHITFFVEDYDNQNKQIPNYNINFFKKLHNLNWKSKKAKKLEKTIYTGCFSDFFTYNNLPFLFCRTFGRAPTYLMGCNALKEGRNSINSEDVVIGYLTTFKIILNDIRPQVWKYYNQEKWTNI